MNKLKTFVGEHRGAALAALFLLIAFVGGSAMSAVNVAQNRAQQAAQSQTGQKQTAEGGQAQTGQKEDVPLTDSQKKAIEGYDDDVRALIDTLSASVWSANNGRCTLRFSDDSYVETVNGKSTTHSYAIERIDKAGDGYGGSIDTIVFETDTGTHVVTYTDGKGSAATAQGGAQQKADGSVISSLASASMFSLKDTAYERADAVESIAVKGLNSEITQLFGGDTDKLTSALSSWCAVHYPTTSEAIWNQVASIDWGDGVITTGFKLNDDQSTELTVVYRMDNGDVEFGF